LLVVIAGRAQRLQALDLSLNIVGSSVRRRRHEEGEHVLVWPAGIYTALGELRATHRHSRLSATFTPTA
jgi:hypothetical protein